MRKFGIVLVCTLVVAGALFLAGCPTKVWSIKAVATPTLVVVAEDATADATSEITITNDGKKALDWTAAITDAPEWVSLDVASGKALAAAGTAKVVLSVDSAAVLADDTWELGTTQELTVTITGADVAKKTDPATQVKSATLTIQVSKGTPAEGEGEGEGEGEVNTPTLPSLASIAYSPIAD